MAFIKLNQGILALLLVTIYQTSANGIERRTVEFDFYGHTVNLSYDSKLNDIRYESAVEQFIKRFDEEGSGPHNASLIEDINRTTNNFGLDDVGKILFIDAFVQKAFAHQPQNFRTLVKWYILYRDSMDVMLCYNAQNITLYGQLDVKPYGVAYINKGNKTYTNLSFTDQPNTAGKVFEYQPKTTIATKLVFKLNRYKQPKLNALSKTKAFAFEYGGKKYNYTSTINQSLILYLKDLPLVELGSLYVNYGFSETVQNTLIAQLKKTITPMNQREALGFLLKFVQEIPYKTDMEYLGKERYAFCEEVLYNDYADCEDKVILYAALAKELLGVQSVALIYENDEHVAIALKMPNQTANYTFTYNNIHYLAAEPSGENFELGKLGFDVKKVTQVVELD
jgi:hypothetical protein